MLGFLYSRPDGSGHEGDPAPRFVSASKFGARIPDFASTAPDFDFVASDCRHGRVLLGDNGYYSDGLVIWDPMTGCTRELEGPDIANHGFKIAVLCALSGCDHHSCHAGPFKLVCVGVDKDEEGECVALACVSSPEMGDWSKPSKLHLDEWKELCPGLDLAPAASIYSMHAVLVHDALHFLLGYEDDDDRVGILKYSLSSNSLSLIDPPLPKSVVFPPLAKFVAFRAPILMAMKNGTLGFAHVDRMLTLYVWYRDIGSDGVACWIHRSVMELKNFLPIEIPRKDLD